ncbi:Saccharopine dehydrogenase-domain-containing protein [Truncatella angustata]|uniref:Saccharopine dehydrogenase-domain-containing protein n=1 Tax=Truncatella angustata TaxID=152316 RepID=A0A9P8RKY8_9PEZI|nr:Saccharopine dehydrogenase-domain-containing protein [Truncatella angustata]KAH6646213.1 Saccharopine dehydrogenase-domain-containing protein [Truncatella angustata]
MVPKKQDRQYGIVLVGATGYTGALTAEHIVQHLPTNLRWAIAGRSKEKLDGLAARLRELAPDRVQPAIEIVSLDRHDQLNTVLLKSNVCISVVSYGRVGTQVIEACIENRTDYIDTFSGIAQLKQWVSQYQKRAEAAGVALIHSCGAFSAPQDLLTWLAVRALKQQTGLPTKEVILSFKKMTLSPSGGTANAILSKPNFDAKTIAESHDPWYLSPVRGTAIQNPINFFGIRKEPYLGVLVASAYGARGDRAVVHRTWGLLQGGKEYGANFHFNEYNSASSTLHGLWKMLNVVLLGLLLSVKPLARLFLPQEGDGPDLEATRHAPAELEAVAIADGDETKKAFARFKFLGGSYYVTGAVLAQGAASLLYTRHLEGGYEGGNLTPAFLGEDFAERLRGAGAEIEVGLL